MANKPMTVADVRLMLKGQPYGEAATASNTSELNRLPGVVAVDATTKGVDAVKPTQPEVSKSMRK